MSRFAPLPTEEARELSAGSVVLVSLFCGTENAAYELTVSKRPRGGKGLVVSWAGRTDSSLRGGWRTFTRTVRSEEAALDFAASKLSFLRAWSAERSTRRAA